MPAEQIRFNDGAAYEEFMGNWSRLAGDAFLRWLDPAPRPALGRCRLRQRRVHRDARRALRAERGAGIDPSAEQIAFARARLPRRRGAFDVGDAMALPYGDDDLRCGRDGAGHLLRSRSGRSRSPRWRASSRPAAASRPIRGTSSAAASRTPRCRRRWPGSPRRRSGRRASRRRGSRRRASSGPMPGSAGIETREIVVERTYADFDSYWRIAQTGPRLAASIAAMASADRQTLSDRLRARLAADAQRPDHARRARERDQGARAGLGPGGTRPDPRDWQAELRLARLARAEAS